MLSREEVATLRDGHWTNAVEPLADALIEAMEMLAVVDSGNSLFYIWNGEKT